MQEEIEEYLESFEVYVTSSISTDFPNFREAIHRLWLDVSRFGPQSLPLPDIHVPGLGHFQVPPPPPPAPPKSWMERSIDWVSLHPWAVGGIVVGVAGTGLLVGYGSMHKHARFRRSKAVTGASNERKQVVGEYVYNISLR